MLKVAILAEKFATDYSWYMDTILTLIRIAGDYVSEEVGEFKLNLSHYLNTTRKKKVEDR